MSPDRSQASGETPGSGLRSLVLRGIAWSMVAVATMQISRFIAGIVLARLLTPHDYGVAAMALIFSSLVLAFSDLSMGAALVQRPTVTERDRATVFWTSFAIGLLLTLAGVALAGPIASFYGEPEVRALFTVVSLSFVLMALQTTQASLLQREMNFRVITLRRMVAVVLGGVVGITMAVLDFGPWSLIAQQVTSTIISTLLLWTFSSWRPSLTFSLESLRDFGSFGLNLLGARLVGYFNRSSDALLIGKFLGSAPLGVYTVAYNVMVLPINRLVIPLQDTLFPAYSRLQSDRDRLTGVWLRVNRVAAAFLLPGGLGLIVVAPDLVPIVLGQQWRPAVEVIQILALVGLLQSLAALGGKVLEALNRPRTILRFSLLHFAVTVPAFVVGLRWGVTGVATAYAVVTVPLSVLYARLTTQALGLSLRTLARALSGVAQASAIMTLGVLLARLALIEAGLPAGARLAAAVIVGIGLYLPLCLWRAPELRIEVERIRMRKRQERAATTPA
jgi:O-antigen/teichoic acid export membrane protein